MQVGWVKIGQFRRKTRYNSKTVQDRCIVFINYSTPVMADVIVCEVLCFVAKNYKRLDKSSLTDIIAKFYHEDELYGAKVVLNKYLSCLMAGGRRWMV